MKKRDEELQKIQLRMSEIELRMSEIEQRLNTFLGHPPGYEGPADPFIGKPPEVKALLTKRTDLETERTAWESGGQSLWPRARKKKGAALQKSATPQGQCARAI